MSAKLISIAIQMQVIQGKLTSMAAENVCAIAERGSHIYQPHDFLHVQRKMYTLADEAAEIAKEDVPLWASNWPPIVPAHTDIDAQGKEQMVYHKDPDVAERRSYISDIGHMSIVPTGFVREAVDTLGASGAPRLVSLSADLKRAMDLSAEGDAVWAMPTDWPDLLFAEMRRRVELSGDDRLVVDDTQLGLELAIDMVSNWLKGSST